jgi:hypothetical protein
MAYIKPKNLTRRAIVDCPVYGNKVRITANYVPTDDFVPALVDFDCNVQGKCGIPSWDPCPLFVRYLEQSHRPLDEAA